MLAHFFFPPQDVQIEKVCSKCGCVQCFGFCFFPAFNRNFVRCRINLGQAQGYCYKYYEFEISLEKIIGLFLGTCFCV